MRRFLAAAILLTLGTVCALSQEKVESKDDPKSDNAGKIVGKWKAAMTEDEKKPFEPLGLYFYFEFRKDGTMEFGAAADKAEGLEFLKKAVPAKGKYKLLAGSKVEVYGLPDNVQLPGNAKGSITTEVKIDGDTMTMTDEGKARKLVRMKEPKKDDKKKEPPAKK